MFYILTNTEHKNIKCLEYVLVTVYFLIDTREGISRKHTSFRNFQQRGFLFHCLSVALHEFEMLLKGSRIK